MGSVEVFTNVFVQVSTPLQCPVVKQMIIRDRSRWSSLWEEQRVGVLRTSALLEQKVRSQKKRFVCRRRCPSLTRWWFACCEDKVSHSPVCQIAPTPTPIALIHKANRLAFSLFARHRMFFMIRKVFRTTSCRRSLLAFASLLRGRLRRHQISLDHRYEE